MFIQIRKLYLLEFVYIKFTDNLRCPYSLSIPYGKVTLDDKKRFLMELLDKNQLYVNYCDMEDETFAVSEEDKAFTNSFYGDM